MRIANLFFAIVFLLFSLNACSRSTRTIPSPTLDSIQAIEEDLNQQLKCGARIPGSTCHTEVENYITTVLAKNNWQVERQTFTINGHSGVNIIGRYGLGDQPFIIGAHYDSRLTADRDPDPEKRMQAMPGANDGASGVAVLLQLAREIPALLSENHPSIWLVFFDLEDNGDYAGWDWILGSTAFVNQLKIRPRATIVVDMVGDKDLKLYYEGNSDPLVRQSIWAVAARLGYGEIFIPQVKYNMIDDHTPFLQKGIPAVDIIDFDYPYWHTTQDTLDKLSAQNIKIVAQTLLEWLKKP